VGHAGTLDPAATGVLPVLLGQATRLSEYLVDATKTYAATVELGVETNTYDREGEVRSTADASQVTRADVEAVLSAFRGEIMQLPPAFSAIKRAGVPLYKLARAGRDVTVEARRVRVDRLDITSWQPPFLQLEIDCSKGFYVRSLAHDIGSALGVSGTLAGLERTRVGTFRVEDAVGLEALRSEISEGSWQDHLYAPDEVLLGWQAAILAPADQRRLSNGQTVVMLTSESAGECRAYGAEGDFVGVLRRETESSWRPVKVFQTAG
jgi:tRNA pseudouridine55 synthase